jgi:hypothetical protein
MRTTAFVRHDRPSCRSPLVDREEKLVMCGKTILSVGAQRETGELFLPRSSFSSTLRTYAESSRRFVFAKTARPMTGHQTRSAVSL